MAGSKKKRWGEVMKERPILFSAPMVRALLDGTKTQTRRIVKCFKHYVPAEEREIDCVTDSDGLPSRVDMIGEDLCPYGETGDKLWVKETWFTQPYHDHQKPTEIPVGAGLFYNATDKIRGVQTPKLRPSLFMCRWMSRIQLEITRVRVERLNDISEADAIAEGIESNAIVSNGRRELPVWRDYAQKNFDPFEWFSSPRDSYRTLWESINGAGSWAVNPWVWVIEFRRVEKFSEAGAI